MVRIRLSPIVAGRAIDAPVELSWTRGEVVVDLEFLGGARLVHELSRTGSWDRTGNLRCIGDEQPMKMWNRAAEVFEHGYLDGLSPDAYINLVEESSGVSRGAVIGGVQRICQALRDIPRTSVLGRPKGACWPATNSLPTGRRYGAVWARRGNRLFVNLPGNNPGVNAIWIEALLYGYDVVLRPSSKDPFTPLRLLRSLIEAGVDQQRLSYVPCQSDCVSDFVDLCDLSLLYGNREVTNRYAGRDDVLVQGPGQSKVLVGAECIDEVAAKLVMDSFIGRGGNGCFSASAAFVESPHDTFAEMVRNSLLGVYETASTMRPLIAGESYAEYLEDIHRQASERNGHVIHEGSDKSRKDLVRGGPVIATIDGRCGVPKRLEYPFPCVWIIRCPEGIDVEMVGDALVVSAIGVSDDLAAALLEAPNISNVYLGAVPTWESHVRVPHDGFLSQFLMRAKGVIVSDG